MALQPKFSREDVCTFKGDSSRPIVTILKAFVSTAERDMQYVNAHFLAPKYECLWTDANGGQNRCFVSELKLDYHPLYGTRNPENLLYS